MKFKLDDILAWILGIGVVLFAFRTKAFNGILFGLVICLLVVFFLLRQSKYWNEETLGSKVIYIPLAVISASIIISGVYQYTQDNSFNTLITRIAVAVLFFGLYLSARILKDKLFKPFAVAVVVEAVSVIISSLFFTHGLHNSGVINGDYNIASALLIFGAIVSIFHKQWAVVLVASLGLLFTGSEEGIFAVVVIFIVMLCRRDYSKKLIIPIVAVAVIGVLGITPFSYTRTLYANTIERASMMLTGKHNEQAYQIASEYNSRLESESNYYNKLDYALNGRIGTVITAFENFQPLGSGYVLNPVDATDMPAYNVPLVVVQQIGVIGGIAWLFLTIYCLVKTKWKYAFIAILALGLLDNLIFCQLGVWWFALVGVATVSQRKSDLIFREKKSEIKTV